MKLESERQIFPYTSAMEIQQKICYGGHVLRLFLSILQAWKYSLIPKRCHNYKHESGKFCFKLFQIRWDIYLQDALEEKM
jgi:hypothetical protein